MGNVFCLCDRDGSNEIIEDFIDDFDSKTLIPYIKNISIANTSNLDVMTQGPPLTELSTTGCANLILCTSTLKQVEVLGNNELRLTRHMGDQTHSGFETFRGATSQGYTAHQKWWSTRSPTEIFRTLFLGSQEDSMNEARLKELEITHILSVMSSKQHAAPSCKLLNVPMADNGNSNLIEVIERTSPFIKESQQDGNTLLVHCHSGQNRSPTLVIAWLMTAYRKNMFDSYMFVKERRRLILPNELYIQKLREYDKHLYGVYSVHPDFLKMTIIDGNVTLKDEDWTPRQSRSYRKSQTKDVSAVLVQLSQEQSNEIRSGNETSTLELDEEKNSPGFDRGPPSNFSARVRPASLCNEPDLPQNEI